MSDFERTDELVQESRTLDPPRAGSRPSGGGRLRLELPDVVVRELPARALSGSGLELAGGGRLDVDDVERLRDELTVWLAERGRGAR